MRVLIIIFLAFLWTSPGAGAAALNDDDKDFIHANTIFFLYHELGHALIDQLRLPVLGQEEDAADVLGIVLSEALNAPDDSAWIATSAAEGFAIMAEIAEDEGYELPFWDLHGLDLQRYFTLICLYYGADPDARQELAGDFELPQERQATCAEEFDLAQASWGPVIEEIAAQQPGQWLHLIETGKPETPAEEIVNAAVVEEVAILNQMLAPGFSVDLRVTHCGEANAFYDPERVEIIICAELSRLFLP